MAKLKLFADDVKLYIHVSNDNNNCSILQLFSNA